MSTATPPGRRARLAGLLALALAEAAAGGCGGAPPREPPAAYRLQQDHARAGARAFAKGDLRAAIAAHERALLAARSVEDATSIALRILDLAALHRAAGDPDEARAALAELLAEPPPLPYPGRWRAEAARVAGLIALDGGDAAAGARWAERSLALCRSARCPGEGAIVNLQARAAFLAGDGAAATTSANEAIALNRAAGNDAELANSSRIVADAALAGGRHAAASRAYEQALQLDKKLGLEPKIVLDLLGLGRAAQAAGRTNDARSFFERARAAARGAGDEQGAAEAAALIESLGPQR
jgi:tetratricopeptide (TPR) repeat protein